MNYITSEYVRGVLRVHFRLIDKREEAHNFAFFVRLLGRAEPLSIHVGLFYRINHCTCIISDLDYKPCIFIASKRPFIGTGKMETNVKKIFLKNLSLGAFGFSHWLRMNYENAHFAFFLKTFWI